MPAPAMRRALDQLARRSRPPQREADGDEHAGGGEHDPQPQQVRQQVAALRLGVAHRQLARAGERQAGVADALHDRQQRHHRAVAAEVLHAEVAQQQHRARGAR